MSQLRGERQEKMANCDLRNKKECFFTLVIGMYASTQCTSLDEWTTGTNQNAENAQRLASSDLYLENTTKKKSTDCYRKTNGESVIDDILIFSSVLSCSCLALKLAF